MVPFGDHTFSDAAPAKSIRIDSVGQWCSGGFHAPQLHELMRPSRSYACRYYAEHDGGATSHVLAFLVELFPGPLCPSC